MQEGSIFAKEGKPDISRDIAHLLQQKSHSFPPGSKERGKHLCNSGGNEELMAEGTAGGWGCSPVSKPLPYFHFRCLALALGQSCSPWWFPGRIPARLSFQSVTDGLALPRTDTRDSSGVSPASSPSKTHVFSILFPQWMLEKPTFRCAVKFYPF